tara:strand:- start:9018 stop:9770 length:753 start_codon:yes stop_codon:yes gene_type:complete
LFEWIASPEAWIALATLVGLEIVLGIDNIIFISILVSRLPVEQRDKARKLGLGFAMLARLGLLFSLVWIMSLVSTLFTVFENDISGRDLILIFGGLFLLAKSTHEIHNSLEVAEVDDAATGSASFVSVLVQIALLDVVFSFDSVITAVGMVSHVSIMAIAIIISVGVMLLAAGKIGTFVDEHPTIKVLSLAFLLLIGMTLVAEGFDAHIPKGYIYFAMAFSVGVEMLNIRMRHNRQTLKLSKKIPVTKIS